MLRWVFALLLFVSMQVASATGAAQAQAPTSGAQTPPSTVVDRIDYLALAQGALPIRVGGAGAQLGVGYEQAIRFVDGSPNPFTFVSGARRDTATEFTYELAASTRFDRFAVPNVLETPSPAQTFARSVEVLGSAQGPDVGYTLLASATLEAHKRRGEVTELAVVEERPVRWVRLRLIGGLDVPAGDASLEFSEIIGNGTQETPNPVYRFRGGWQGTGVSLELRQDGSVVSGCYDTGGELKGTVTGNILRATGVVSATRVRSAFILGVAADGTLRGVRSTNGAPFRLYTAPKSTAGTAAKCAPPPATLGCGSVLHGVVFDFDSAILRPESTPVLAALFEGLKTDARASILIEGHTSNEGAAEYNLGLSQRRAQAVVADLMGRGIGAQRLRASGAGESRPIAGNDDENGRALNRRVEVTCQ